METKKINQVTNFMYYMYNRWNLTEAKYLFGKVLGQHIFDKYIGYGYGKELLWYAELDSTSKQKLIDRVDKLYSNNNLKMIQQ